MAPEPKSPEPSGVEPDELAAAAGADLPAAAETAAASAVREPPAPPSMMERQAAAGPLVRPRRLPLLGRLPFVRQFQLLGVVVVAFLALGALFVYVDGRGVPREAVICAVVALAALLLLGKVLLDDARSRAWQSEHENRRNQDAILRLLNEMGTWPTATSR